MTRAGLSSATAKLLAQPPIPLQLAYVEFGKEFPDPASPLQTLVKLVESWKPCHLCMIQSETSIDITTSPVPNDEARKAQ